MQEPVNDKNAIPFICTYFGIRNLGFLIIEKARLLVSIAEQIVKSDALIMIGQQKVNMPSF